MFLRTIALLSVLLCLMVITAGYPRRRVISSGDVDTLPSVIPKPTTSESSSSSRTCTEHYERIWTSAKQYLSNNQWNIVKFWSEYNKNCSISFKALLKCKSKIDAILSEKDCSINYSEVTQNCAFHCSSETRNDQNKTSFSSFTVWQGTDLNIEVMMTSKDFKGNCTLVRLLGVQFSSINNWSLNYTCVNTTDVDECQTFQSDCNSNATCNNTLGGFNCICNQGFSGNGFHCQDVDECQTFQSDCNSNATCNNTLGGFNCTCNQGFSGNGFHCQDVDECQTFQSDCNSNATCNNTLGGFNCTCNQGFSGNGSHCQDVDECQTFQSDCNSNATCNNTVGGFNCTCNQGFSGNGSHCQDVDECQTFQSDCNSNATCNNTLGGFNCTCNQGFSGNGSHCQDVDECQTFQSDCNSNATCNNTLGGFNCTCNQGFSGNGFHCQDVDECQTFESKCHSNATCNNTLGGFNCTCNQGFSGNGSHCQGYRPYTTEGVRTEAKELERITASGNLSKNDVENGIGFLKNVSKLAEAGKVKVSKQMLTSMINITKNFHDYWKTKTTDTSATVENQKLKSDLVKSITLMALHVELDDFKPVFDLSTKTLVIRVAENRGDEYTKFSFSPKLEGSEVSAVNITIPRSALSQAWSESAQGRSKRETNTSSSKRSAFIYYKDDTLFYSEQNVSSVIAADLGSQRGISGLQDPVTIQYLNEIAKYGKQPPTNNTFQALKTTLKCVYWDFDTSKWHTDGCCLNVAADPPECQCNHLTNFALIVASDKTAPDIVLSVVSDVGCCLSIVGLAITIASHVYNREVRKRRPAKILIQICSSLLTSYIIFVIGVSRTEYDIGCTIVVVLLQYFMLTTWCWMSVYSYDMYMSVVKVFRNDSSGFMQKACAFAYGFPFVLVVLNIGVAVGYYDQQQENLLCGGVADPNAKSHYKAENMCWLTGYSLNFGFLLPVGTLLVYNTVVFSMVFREISCKRMEIQSSALRRTNKQTLLIAVTMTSIMGITWVFGYLLLISDDFVYQSIMSWIFAILNTLQGFGIFLLTSVRSDDLRRVWWKPLRSVVSRTTSSASGAFVRFRKAEGKYTVSITASEQQVSMSGIELHECITESCDLEQIQKVQPKE